MKKQKRRNYRQGKFSQNYASSSSQYESCLSISSFFHWVNMYEPCTLLRLQSYRHRNVIQRLTDWSLYTRVWPVSPGKYMYASQPTNISHRPSSPVSLATKTHKEYKLWCLHRHGFITMHPSDVSRRASSSCEYSIEVSHTANSLWHYYKTRLFSML